MRLIDIDTTYPLLKERLTWLGQYGDDVYRLACECIRGVMETQPVAYDVDKVVGCIEAIKEKENGACDEEDCGYCQYFNTCCDGDMSDRLALDKAIEIVKGGGVEK